MVVRKRLFVIAAAAIALAALAIPRIHSSDNTRKIGRAASGGSRDQKMKVSMQVVHAEKLRDRVSTVGTILANEEVEIRSETSGKIDAISFREGGRVTKGDLLVKLNDAELRPQLLRARSRLSIAQRLEERQSRLVKESLTSQEEYDNAATNLDIAKAEVQLIVAQIDATQIRAPFDGRVGLRHVSEGSYVTPSTPIATLLDDRTVKLDFAVPEKYSGEIHEGDRVDFGIQGSSMAFAGTIYAIQPGIDPDTRTLRIRAASPNVDGALRSGALATVNVLFGEKDALMIPSYAIIPDLKGHRAFVCTSGKAESRSVEIGIRTDERVEITRGLAPGDTLITSGILQLRPGMAVRRAQDESASLPSSRAKGEDR